MTKRRPLSSKLLRQVAALLCSLLLLNGSSTVWAASKKPHGKRHAAARTAKKHTASSPRALPEADVGAVDIVESDTTGLRGHASFYGAGFNGRKTATGDIFDVREFTAASNRFPLGTMVAVRRLDNDRCAIVKVNDRMHPKHRKRIIDVSRGVAEYLNMIRAGVVLVRVAPLKSGWKSQGGGACQAAFEPEQPCVACEPPTRLPDF